MEEKKKELQFLTKRDQLKARSKIISEILDKDQLNNCIQSGYKYLKNYLEGPSNFAVEENRIIFWNKENLIIKVLDYNHNAGLGCTYAHFSY